MKSAAAAHLICRDQRLQASDQMPARRSRTIITHLQPVTVLQRLVVGVDSVIVVV
jgi:hypothetical protein